MDMVMHGSDDRITDFYSISSASKSHSNADAYYYDCILQQLNRLNKNWYEELVVVVRRSRTCGCAPKQSCHYRYYYYTINCNHNKVSH